MLGTAPGESSSPALNTMSPSPKEPGQGNMTSQWQSSLVFKVVNSSQPMSPVKSDVGKG